MTDTTIEPTDPVIIVQKKNLNSGRLGMIAVIMALITSSIALVGAIFDNRRLERDVVCLRESAVAVDVAVAAELASLGEAAAVVIEGLLATQTDDEARFSEVLLAAEDVIAELRHSAAELDAAVKGRTESLESC